MKVEKFGKVEMIKGIMTFHGFTFSRPGTYGEYFDAVIKLIEKSRDGNHNYILLEKDSK